MLPGLVPVQKVKDKVIKVNRHANQMGVSMTVPVNMNGLNTDMLLDTGAVVTILSKDTFDKIPKDSKPILKPLTEPVYLEVADAGQLRVEGMAVMTMEIGSQEYTKCTVYRWGLGEL